MNSPRIQLLLDRLRGNSHGLTLTELFKNVFAPPAVKLGMSTIERTVEVDKHILIYFKGYNSPLYWPKHMDINTLREIAGDSIYPYRCHYYETEHTRVSSDDIVIDCGAAEGLFGFLVAKRCKKIFLIEPLPDFIDSLALTFKGYKNAEIIPLALGSKEGSSLLSSSGACSSLTRDKKDGIPVKISTLDKLFFDKGIPVSYIKADLEGYEMEVLKGAVNTIKAFTPKIAITTYHNPGHSREISDFIRSIDPDYKMYVRGLAYCGGINDAVLHAWKAQ